MARAGLRKVARYGEQFKATAVKLSRLPGVLIQDVAGALDIHPFMLSLWRKQAREGMIVTRGVKLDVETAAELKRLRQLERQYKLLKEEHELLKKAIRFVSNRKEANRGGHQVTLMCRLYGVTRAGYYAWRARERSERARDNAQLVEKIEAIHEASRGTYGSPRVHRALRQHGWGASENRVARLMRAHGIKARVAKLTSTNPGLVRFFGSIPNRQLDVEVTGPNQVWIGDITYLKVGKLWRYLAVVLDKYSRRVLGWSFGRNKDVKLTLRALNRAAANRRPAPGLIFHTDRGIEYAAHAFKDRLAKLNITQSMNRPGKVTDNAYIESFFHSMKTDVVHGNAFTEDREIESMVRRYIPFYNRTRLHSSLHYVSPATYEKQLA